MNNFKLTDKTITIIFAAIFAVLLATAALWPVFNGDVLDKDSGSSGGIFEKEKDENNDSKDSDKDKSGDSIDKQIQTKPVKQSTRFIHQYPNFGEYTGIPIGGWVNLDKGISPDLRGNVGVIAYIVHYQGFTKKTLPFFQELHEKYMHKDTVVVGVNQEYLGRQDQNTNAAILASMREKGATFPVVMDANERDGDVTEILTVSAYPSAFVVDKWGNVRYVFTNTERNELILAIEELQKQTEVSPPTVQEIMSAQAKMLKDFAGIQNPSSIEVSWVHRVNTSQFYEVVVKVYKPGVDRNKGFMHVNDYVEVKTILGMTDDEKWVVGVPFDANYCRMLKEVPLTHDEEKKYELHKC